jgi:hypothetical protein
MIRSKNVRNRHSRWLMVVADSLPPLRPGRLAIHVLCASTWRCSIAATDRQAGSTVVMCPANIRSASS